MTLPRQRGGTMDMMAPRIPRAPMMEGNMARPNASAPLGQGGRFAAVEASAAASGARNPAAVAAAAGRKKYGAKKMAGWAAAGRKKGRNSKAKKRDVRPPGDMRDKGKSNTTTVYQGGNNFKSY